VVYGEMGRGCAIVVPENATGAETDAARLVSATVALAASREAKAFPVIAESAWRAPRRAIFIGDTLRGREEVPLHEHEVAWAITGSAITIRARRSDDVSAAASLFLEEVLGARWFMPGTLGREVPVVRELRLTPQRHRATPGYFSRALGGTENSSAGRAWAHANRLGNRLPGGHTAHDFTPPAVLAQHPDFAPQLVGAGGAAAANNAANWQPNLLAAGFSEHVAREVIRHFRATPDVGAVQFALNDANRFDQSPATLEAVAPPRYFRGRPDYSPLFYRFLNDVATRVARELPDRFISTYAYYWTENTPSFPVAPNIVPYLTSDRSMWSDPVFAQEDRALIARWGSAGPKFIALYDYLYGAPFFVPRPTLWAVTQPIRYGWEHGARAYYAEMTPNWALDGPKPWLAAQLLWGPTQSSAMLLDEYYARFWQEAAGPMRAFYELCDAQWRNQPRPLRWVKYLRDEDQRRLFPPEVRAELRQLLAQAEGAARSPIVRARVKFVSEAFKVSQAFCEHDELREDVNRLVFAGNASIQALCDGWERYSAKRAALVDQYRLLKQREPLAIQSDLDVYLRNDPRPKLAAALAARGALSQIPARLIAPLFENVTPSEADLTGPGRERLLDPQLREVAIPSTHPFAFTDWGRPTWQGRTEPAETREISLWANSDGSKRVRYVGCMNESLSQWVPATPDRLYRAKVLMKGHVSPGSVVMLSVSFLGKKNERVGRIHVDRLPVGAWNDWTALEIIVRAPANAAWLGVSPSVYNQMPGDWLEFEGVSVREIEFSIFR